MDRQVDMSSPSQFGMVNSQHVSSTLRIQYKQQHLPSSDMTLIVCLIVITELLDRSWDTPPLDRSWDTPPLDRSWDTPPLDMSWDTPPLYRS